MAWWLRPRIGVLFFAVLVVVVLVFLLDMIGIHLPYVAKYLTLMMVVAFYILVGLLRFPKG